MKRNIHFAFMQGLDISSNGTLPTSYESFMPNDDTSELVRLLKLVFSKDDRGLVTGDLAYAFAKDADPNVIKFIKDVLQQDTSSLRQPSIPDGMSDEDIEALSPHVGELFDSYKDRLADYIKRSQSAIDDAKSKLNEK